MMVFKKVIAKKLAYYIIFLQLSIFPSSLCVSPTKIKELGPKLQEFIDHYPEQNWLIKFYAPWCNRCQKLEPTFNNVAERIYDRINNLVVGKVNCVDHPTVCEKYEINAYPTIMFLSKDQRYIYKDLPAEDAIIGFAERLVSPAITSLKSCDHYRKVLARRKNFVLSTETNLESEQYENLKSVASSMRSDYWFYRLDSTLKCNNQFGTKGLKSDGLYIAKEDLFKPILYQPKTNVDSKNHIMKWVTQESFPLYGEFHSQNSARYVNSGKIVVIAVLEEYAPAKILTPLSKEWQKKFEKLAIASSNNKSHEELLFAWSRDLYHLEFIAATSVRVPNVMILTKDYSHKLIVPFSYNDQDKTLPSELNSDYILSQVELAKRDSMTLVGGNTPLHMISRNFFVTFKRLWTAYQTNPLLVILLLIVPMGVLLFVILQTCFDWKMFGVSGDYEESDETSLHPHQE